MLLLAMIAGSTRALRAESTTAAATALVVLLTGYSEDGGMLVDRLLDTFVGIARRPAGEPRSSGRRCATAAPRGGSASSTTGSASC